jgi:serralysin
VADHGTDWVQDYSAGRGRHPATGHRRGDGKANFQVNYARTPGAGTAAVTEAFVIYKPTGQILWALIDAPSAITVQSGSAVFDLLGVSLGLAVVGSNIDPLV